MGGDLNKKSMHVTEPRMGLGNLRSDTFTFSYILESEGNMHVRNQCMSQSIGWYKATCILTLSLFHNFHFLT